MQRRTFVAGMAAVTLAPCVAHGQRTKPVVGILSPWEASLAPRGQREPFERGLRELGWTPSSTVVIEHRYAAGNPDELPKLANELVQMPVDVIVANGTQAIRGARQATSTIPIVMAAANDPVREGLIQSLARPGGNVTGLSILPQGRIEAKQLELLTQAVPALTRVGVLANRAGDPTVTKEIGAAAQALGLRIEGAEVSRPTDIAHSIGALAHAGVGAVLVRPDPLVLDAHLAEVAKLAVLHRPPNNLLLDNRTA